MTLIELLDATAESLNHVHGDDNFAHEHPKLVMQSLLAAAVLQLANVLEEQRDLLVGGASMGVLESLAVSADRLVDEISSGVSVKLGE